MSNINDLKTKIMTTVDIGEVIKGGTIHRRSQPGFCLGEAPGHASVVQKFEAVAGSWWTGSAPAVSRVMGGAPE